MSWCDTSIEPMTWQQSMLLALWTFCPIWQEYLRNMWKASQHSLCSRMLIGLWFHDSTWHWCHFSAEPRTSWREREHGLQDGNVPHSISEATREIKYLFELGTTHSSTALRERNLRAAEGKSKRAWCPASPSSPWCSTYARRRRLWINGVHYTLLSIRGVQLPNSRFRIEYWIQWRKRKPNIEWNIRKFFTTFSAYKLWANKYIAVHASASPSIA